MSEKHGHLIWCLAYTKSFLHRGSVPCSCGLLIRVGLLFVRTSFGESFVKSHPRELTWGSKSQNGTRALRFNIKERWHSTLQKIHEPYQTTLQIVLAQSETRGGYTSVVRPARHPSLCPPTVHRFYSNLWYMESLNFVTYTAALSFYPVIDARTVIQA